MSNWRAELRREFERAETARARGNEGQARVCARRAAGIAAREYLTRRGHPLRTPSANDLLSHLAADPHLPPDLRQAAVNLTLRVTEEFTLPVEADLLAEARRLCRGLVGEGEGEGGQLQ